MFHLETQSIHQMKDFLSPNNIQGNIFKRRMKKMVSLIEFHFFSK